MGKAGHREVVGLRSDVGASVGVGVPLLLLPSEGEEDESDSKEAAAKEIAEGSEIGNRCAVWVGASTPEEGNKNPANVKKETNLKSVKMGRKDLNCELFKSAGI